MAELRKSLNQKSVLYAELLGNSRILIDINEQSITNEKDAMLLRQEIDVNTVEIEEKRQKVKAMQAQLAKNKEIYKALKREI